MENKAYSYEEYVVNLLLVLLYSKFLKVKITFFKPGERGQKPCTPGFLKSFFRMSVCVCVCVCVCAFAPKAINN